MKTLKKGASLLLVLSMIFSMVVTCAFADDTEPSGSAGTDVTEETEQTEQTEQEEASLPEETEPAAQAAEEEDPAAEAAGISEPMEMKSAEEPAEETGTAADTETPDAADPGIRMLDASVDNAADFKTNCENGSGTVVITLTADIVMNSESLLITSIGPSNLTINGNGHTITLDIATAESGSLTMFKVSGSKTLTFSGVNIDAGNQQFLAASSFTAPLTLENMEISNLYGTGLSVTMTSTNGSVTMNKVTCTSCNGTFFSGGNYSKVTVTDSVLSAKALKDGDSVLYMSGSANASNSLLTVQGSTITMDDNEFSAYGVYTYGRCGLTLEQNATVSVIGSGESTYAIYYDAYYNENYNSSYPYKLTINDSTITRGDESTEHAVIYLSFCGSSSNAYRYSPILHTDGKLDGNPVVCLNTDMYIATSGALQDTVYFDYPAGAGGADPTLAVGEAGENGEVYQLQQTDAEKLVCAGENSVRTVKLDKENNSILFCRSDQTVEIHVNDENELYAALTGNEYCDYGQVIIYLDDNIKMTTDTIIASGNLTLGTVVIDGSPEMLESGEANGETFTLTGPEYSVNGTANMFSLGSLSGYDFTLQNMVIDCNQQRLIDYGSMSLTLENIELRNMHANDYGIIGIINVTGGTGTSLTMTKVTTNNEEYPSTGMLIYTSGECAMVLDQCTLATHATDGAPSSTLAGMINRLINTTGASANGRSSLTISGGSLSFYDTEELSGTGLYLDGYIDVTMQGDAVISGSRYNQDTNTVYVNSANCNVNMEGCSFVNGGGRDPVIYLNGSGRLVHTNGGTQGMSVLMPVITDSSNAPIRISGELGYDIKVDFTGTVNGTDPVLAAGENDYAVTDEDAQHMAYSDETAPRIARVQTGDTESYITLYRSNIADCEITLLKAAGYKNDVPYYWATSENQTIEPEVEVRNANGNLISDAYYTVAYENNVLPEDAEIGYEQEATVTVTPVEDSDLTGGAVNLSFKLIVPDTIDISNPDNNCEMVISYDYSSGGISVTVTHDGVELTEGVDFTVEYTIDPDRYTMNITVTGIGIYEGTLAGKVKLPGYDSHVFEVVDEPTLNEALSQKFETIVFANNITVSDYVEIDYPVTIIGDGHNLSLGLNVNAGAELVVRDMEVNSGLTVYAQGTAEMTEGSSVRTVYVEENGVATLGDCTVGGGAYLQNYGTLTIGEGTCLSDVALNEIANYTTQYMIYNDGVLNWAGQFDVNYADGIGTGTGATGSVIYNTENATVNMTGGEINGYLLNEDGTYSDERTEAFYGAILNYGTLNMSGGTITGFSANGVVTNNTSTSTMGGNIPGGGGVRNKGVFNMSGGVITGNTAEDHSNGDSVQERTDQGLGGGVYNDCNAVFTMSGGEISENTATLGGGVFNIGPDVSEETSAGATFTMTGGTIRDNRLFGDEVEVDNNVGGMGGGTGVNVANVGSEICSVGGAVTSISGGTVSGDDLIYATVINDYGNEEKTQIQAGIALDTAYSLSSGANMRTTYAENADCSMTVTGDPDIQVGILLINNLLLLQEGSVISESGSGNDKTIDEYELYDLFPEYYYSWLWLDGGLTTPLNVTTLDLNNYEVEWIGNNTAAGWQNIYESNLTVNSDRSIIAFYPEGMDANQTEGEQLYVDGENPRQVYYYENRVNLYRNSSNMGMTTDPIEIDTLFDYEAWVLCYHSEIDDIEEIDEIPATCEEYGTAGHYECTYCGAMFTDLECTDEVTIDDLLLDPLDHKYSDGTDAIQWDDGKAATCTEDGYEAGYTCELCGRFFFADDTEDTTGSRILDALGHDWIVVDEIPATETADGQTAYCECSRCGERLTEPEVIPATGVEADKTALETAIGEAQALLDSADSPYSEESLNTLRAAVDAATEADEKDGISQTEVNNALADLLDAVMALENEDSDAPDDTALQMAIDSAEALLEDEDSPYTDESLEILAAVVEAATNDVLNNPDATQDDIDDAVDAIVAAIRDMEKTPLPDTGDLEAMIDTAEAVMDQLDESDYTESSWSALTDALENAEAVAADPESQDAVDEALDALASALTGLERAADKSALETLIDAAAELDEDDYTPDTWKALQDALDAADAVNETELTADEQSTVDGAAEALLNAIIALEKVEPEAETDLTALQAAIAAAKALDQADYTTASWDTLKTALDAAEALDDSASQEDVDDAAVALMNAIGSLVKVADTSALETLIDTAKNDLKETDYTQASWENLTAALEAAEALLDKELTADDQSEVNDAAGALMQAIIGLEKAEVPVDKTGLEAMIEQVKAQYPDEAEDNYTEDSWKALQDALAAAEAVDADENVTQDDVYEVLSNLMDAVMNLKAADGTGEETPNTAGLEIAIQTAETLLDEIKDSDTYTSDSVQALEDAVNAAKALLDSDDADAVKEAADNIMDAISGLVPNTAASAAEKSALESAITAAQKMADSSEYTSETVEALEKAIADAQDVLSSDNPSEQDVSKALQAITDAVNGLEVNTDPTASDEDKADLETVINAAEKLDSSSYTSDSWSAMQEALAAANSVLSDSGATRSQVSEAMMTLTLAISSLVPTGNGGTTGTKDGFVYEDGEWHYYDNGTRFTADDIKEDQNKTIDGTDGWYYIVSGKVDFSYTGVSHFENAYGWWYVKNGKVDFSCNSVEQNQYGWWYVVGGKVDFSYTGVSNYSNAYGWWYIEKGKVNFGKTSIEPNNYGWWRVVDGKVDFSCNSVEQNDYGWWYVVGGKVDFSYTGVSNYSNAYGWWYISKGKVDFSCNSVEQNQYGWWYVLGGKVQFGYTGVANYANAYGWWYIKEGKVDFSFTGTASNNYGTWNVVNGKVVF